MQRIIKFRAWDGKYKKMRYKVVVGNLHDEENYTAHAVYLKPGDTDYNIDLPGRWMNFDEHSNFVLMQFTGLYDNNGKEIYEGDVLSKEPFLKVTFENGGFCFSNDLLSGSDRLSQERVGRLSIIGNIHENPELCKG